VAGTGQESYWKVSQRRFANAALNKCAQYVKKKCAAARSTVLRHNFMNRGNSRDFQP
jgi:hypothetical protein